MRKILSIILCLSIVLSITACASQNPPTDESLEKNEESDIAPTAPGVVIHEESENENLDFTQSLKKFLISQNTLPNSYMVSPMSYRFAMGMLTAGANGSTQEELLYAMDFDSIDEYLDWAANIIAFSEQFKTMVKTEDSPAEEKTESEFDYYEQPATGAFEIANSLWHNKKDVAKLKEEFCSTMKEKYNAEIHDIAVEIMAQEINKWVDEKTHGMIPEIVNNLPADISTVLVNTVYFKSAWTHTFSEISEPMPFYDVDNHEIQKDFMKNEAHYKYFSNPQTEMVVIPMEGNVDVILIMGDDSNYQSQLEEAKYKNIELYIPKWETDTSLENSELLKYLSYKNVDIALSANADYSTMIDSSVQVDDIIQKTSIKLDEEGLEASAATAILIKNTAMIEKQPEKVIFDKTFQYYIVANTNNGPEVMFFGQLGD